jgi:formylmethanofuran dehydrogenase subunit B
VAIVSNAVCTFCGCTCDDIELHTEGDHIVKARHACRLGTTWFTSHSAEAEFPAALIGGEPASVDEAISHAADILAAADYPLLYGLSNTTCETQRLAISLAERLSGAIDSHSSL